MRGALRGKSAAPNERGRPGQVTRQVPAGRAPDTERMDAPAALLDLLRTAGALLLGYLAGSLPVSAWVVRTAGVDLPRDGDARPGSADAWRLAGPGWGLLALTGELAQGVVPVAIAIVTFGWWTGWAAAVGAVAGAGWPTFGRRAGGPGVATLAGVCVALAPLAGLAGLAVAALVAVAGRLAGRSSRAVATGAGFGSFVVLAVVELADAARLAGVGLLFLVMLGRFVMTRSRPATA